MTRIKEILKCKGMSVGDLAEKLKISRQALSKQIQGKLLVETAERIARALDVELYELFKSKESIIGGQSLGLCSDNNFVALIKDGDRYYCPQTKDKLLAVAMELSGRKVESKAEESE